MLLGSWRKSISMKNKNLKIIVCGVEIANNINEFSRSLSDAGYNVDTCAFNINKFYRNNNYTFSIQLPEWILRLRAKYVLNKSECSIEIPDENKNRISKRMIVWAKNKIFLYLSVLNKCMAVVAKISFRLYFALVSLIYFSRHLVVKEIMYYTYRIFRSGQFS